MTHLDGKRRRYVLLMGLAMPLLIPALIGLSICERVVEIARAWRCDGAAVVGLAALRPRSIGSASVDWFDRLLARTPGGGVFIGRMLRFPRGAEVCAGSSCAPAWRNVSEGDETSWRRTKRYPGR